MIIQKSYSPRNYWITDNICKVIVWNIQIILLRKTVYQQGWQQPNQNCQKSQTNEQTKQVK